MIYNLQENLLASKNFGSVSQKRTKKLKREPSTNLKVRLQVLYISTSYQLSSVHLIHLNYMHSYKTKVIE